MNNKVFIAEDDSDIIELLKLYLESNEFVVNFSTNGKEALSKIKESNCDIALVDIMLPEMNGYDLIKEIRKISNVPIIIISAKNMDVDKVLGLNIGADAYITKPFNPLEVIANIKAILRRCYELGNNNWENNNKNLVVGDLTLEVDKYILRKKEEIIPLTSTELKIVAKMMASPGKVFTKSQLYECIGGEFYESDDNTMMVHISNIRAKVEDNPTNPDYIVTVRGLGYKIENKKKK